MSAGAVVHRRPQDPEGAGGAAGSEVGAAAPPESALPGPGPPGPASVPLLSQVPAPSPGAGGAAPHLLAASVLADLRGGSGEGFGENSGEALRASSGSSGPSARSAPTLRSEPAPAAGAAEVSWPAHSSRALEVRGAPAASGALAVPGGGVWRGPWSGPRPRNGSGCPSEASHTCCQAPSLPLPGLQQSLLQVVASEVPPAHPHGRAPFLLRLARLRQEVHALRRAGTPLQDAHGRKALLLPPLPQAVLTERPLDQARPSPPSLSSRHDRVPGASSHTPRPRATRQPGGQLRLRPRPGAQPYRQPVWQSLLLVVHPRTMPPGRFPCLLSARPSFPVSLEHGTDWFLRSEGASRQDCWTLGRDWGPENSRNSYETNVILKGGGLPQDSPQELVRRDEPRNSPESWRWSLPWTKRCETGILRCLRSSQSQRTLVSYPPTRVDLEEGIRGSSLGNGQDWIGERPLETEMISISVNSNVY